MSIFFPFNSYTTLDENFKSIGPIVLEILVIKHKKRFTFLYTCWPYIFDLLIDWFDFFFSFFSQLYFEIILILFVLPRSSSIGGSGGRLCSHYLYTICPFYDSNQLLSFNYLWKWMGFFFPFTFTRTSIGDKMVTKKKIPCKNIDEYCRLWSTDNDCVAIEAGHFF